MTSDGNITSEESRKVVRTTGGFDGILLTSNKAIAEDGRDGETEGNELAMKGGEEFVVDGDGSHT